MPQIPPTQFERLVRGRRNMLGTLEIHPANFTFETQEPDEKVYIKCRAHPFVNLGWIINSAFLIVLPLISLYVYSILPFDFDIRDYVTDYILLVIVIVYYSINMTSVFFNFLDWYYDVYIVTNQRIVNIQFDPLKRYRISETRLVNIEHVDESVVGLFPSMFNFGNVIVSTAAKRGLFIFRAVPDPAWFRDILMDLSRFMRGGQS